MAPNKNFTYNHSSPYRHPPTSDHDRAIDSPDAYSDTSSTRHTTPSLPRELLGPDLFNNLLFNRTTVYENRAGPFAPRPVKATVPVKRGPSVARVIDTPKDDDTSNDSKVQANEDQYEQADQSGMLSRLSHPRSRMAPKSATVSKPRGRPAAAKKTPAKKKPMAATPKKRPGTPASNSRSTKIPKTKANSKKKVDARSSDAVTRSPTIDVEVIEISSGSEDEGEDDSRGHAMQTEMDEEGRKPTVLENGWLENEPGVPPQPVASQRPLGITVSEAMETFPTKFDAPEDSAAATSLHNFQNELCRNEAENSLEMQLLHEQLEATKADRGRLEKQIGDMELARTNSDNAKDAKYNALVRNFSAEQDKLRAVTQERDQIRIDLDNSKARNKELVSLLEAEKCLRQTELREHQAIIKDITSSKSSSSTFTPSTPIHLQSSNARLQTENDGLRSQALLSPAPSSTSSSSQDAKMSTLSSQQATKQENLRKTYTIVKRRYDSLHYIASDLATCTRSMDLNSFGEFGGYLRRLRNAVEVDNAERAGIVHVARDADDAK